MHDGEKQASRHIFSNPATVSVLVVTKPVSTANQLLKMPTTKVQIMFVTGFQNTDGFRKQQRFVVTSVLAF